MSKNSRRGQLLIASATMTDPNFARSVVLLVRDNEDEGTFGLVINRPLAISVSDGLGDQVEAARQVQTALHQGGPCQGPFTALHASAGGRRGGDRWGLV